jgi:hypothetical protein
MIAARYILEQSDPQRAACTLAPKGRAVAVVTGMVNQQPDPSDGLALDAPLAAVRVMAGEIDQHADATRRPCLTLANEWPTVWSVVTE